MSKPIVALVGRPNVGKSTLFNRLIGEQRAIVSDIPGTTRDRLYGDTIWNGVTFTVVDTGGLDILAEHRRLSGEPEDVLAAGSAHFLREIRAQAEIALEEADVIVFIVDVTAGLTPADEHVLDILRRSNKPILLAANKADNLRLWRAADEFYATGLDAIYPISALNGKGVGDLLDAIVATIPPEAIEEEPFEGLKLAIVGRPNVGKSSLLNRLLGEERAIVSPIPGTTRDAIDTIMEWEGHPIMLIDTAGIRRRGKQRGLEFYSVVRTLRAIRRADVVLLMVDATEGVTEQDAHIAGQILEEAKSVIVLVNKWDAIEKDTYTMHTYTQHIRHELRFMDYVPLLFISALTGQRVHRIFPTAFDVHTQRLQRVPTSELNRIMRDAIAHHRPPTKAGRPLKFYYATQVDVDPPTFVFFVNDPDMVHFSYERYIENQIRERYTFLGTPLRFYFRRRRQKRRS